MSLALTELNRMVEKLTSRVDCIRHDMGDLSARVSATEAVLFSVEDETIETDYTNHDFGWALAQLKLGDNVWRANHDWYLELHKGQYLLSTRAGDLQVVESLQAEHLIANDWRLKHG